MDAAVKFLNRQVSTNKAPSVQYSFFDARQVLFTFRTGLADIGNSRPVDHLTTSHFFSITKTFTAVAVLQLADQGLVGIADPIQKYLPDFRYGQHITLRHVLSHSAGIPNPMPLRWTHLVNEHDTFNQKLFFQGVFDQHQKTRSTPNERFSYSNLGYVILGQLIENVTGLGYEEYLTQRIFKKLGLDEKQIGFKITDFSKHAIGYHSRVSFSNLVLSFLIDKSKFMGKPEGAWLPFNHFYVNGTAYGGIVGTSDALVRYVQELLKPNNDLLSATGHAALFSENFTEARRATGMCLSWFKGSLNGNTYFTHAGGGGGYYVEIRLYPERQQGSVILFNRTGLRDERFLNKVDKYFLT